MDEDSEIDEDLMREYAPDINGTGILDIVEAACVKVFNRKEA